MILKIFRILISATVIFFIITDMSIGKEEWYSIYFTSPTEKNPRLKKNNPELELLSTINSAKKSLYCAFYDISSNVITNAIINAGKRGVDVKVVTERDNFHGPQVNRLVKNGISLVTDSKSGLMHNKFAIVDGNILWTGSYNITDNGSMRNNNNAIKIYSRQLADIYLDEFMEMYRDRIFGNRKEYSPFIRFRKKYHVRLGESDINVYFAPEDNVERIILKRLKKAKKSIHFMAFSFTSDRIGEMIINKFKKGVSVFGIFESKGTGSRYSEYIKMKVEGLPVRKDKNRYTMHHKVIIIDGRLLITGSYNFSKNANRKNDENILIIDNLKLAGEFITEFYRLYR